jgi:hypothetical protein
MQSPVEIRIATYLRMTAIHSVALERLSDTSQIPLRVLMHQRRK